MPPTYLKLYWDGIYNIKPDGALVQSGGPDGLPDYALNRFLLDFVPTGESGFSKIVRPIVSALTSFNPSGISSNENTVQQVPIAVRIGMKDAKGWHGVAASYHPNGSEQRIPDYEKKMQHHFIPYESLLEIPITLQNIDRVQVLMLRIFRGKTDPTQTHTSPDDRRQRDAQHLVYQEVFDKAALARISLWSPDWKEPLEVKRRRTARYWGLECFANWYHQTYTVELWASTDANAFAQCSGTRAPQENRPATVHHHSPRSGELDEEHFQWTQNMGSEGLGYCRFRAADVIHQLFDFDRQPELFPWLDDFGRIQRFTRNIPKYVEHLRHIDTYLQQKPSATILEALEYYEQVTSFPKVQIVPLSGLPGPDFLHLTTHAYPLDDIGAGTTHGIYTHRLQWAAISSLITNQYRVGRRQEHFYHTPLQLYVRAGDPGLHAPESNQAQYFCTRFDFPVPLFQWLCDRTGEPRSIPIFFVEEGDEGPLHHADALHMFLLTGEPRTDPLEKAIAELSRLVPPENPYTFPLQSSDTFFAPPNNRQLETLTKFELKNTYAHFWLGRFVERLNKHYGVGTSVFGLLGIKSFTWTGAEDDEKLAGLLKPAELKDTALRVAKLAQAKAPLPRIAERLMPLWLEMRIAIIAGQLAIADVNNQLRRAQNDNSPLRTITEIVDDEIKQQPKSIGEWAVSMLTKSEVQHMLELNRNIINLTPLWPWVKPLRMAVEGSSTGQFRYMIGYEGKPIDAVMQRKSWNLSKTALGQLLAQSEGIVDQGAPAGFKPIGIFFFEGSPASWKEYAWPTLSIDQLLEQ